jgi:hypothetical protein
MNRQCQNAPAATTWRSLCHTTRLSLLVALAVVTVTGLELVSRINWLGREHLPAVRTEAVWRMFFPEWNLAGVDTLAAGDGMFHVLLLGGSALVKGFGDIEPRLQAALQTRLKRPVRVVNLAYIGRASLDSRIKYERLDHPFDLVVVYHGINDAYLNNCPASAFRPDYTHADRFRHLRALEQHPEFSCFALPYTARYLVTSALDRLMLSNRPRRQWHKYGGNLKTPPCFEDNLERIAVLARARRARLLLMTFAYYIPADYTEEAFERRALDYAEHSCAISLWGTPENVGRAIHAHNDAVRRIAARHDEALFVDQSQLMPVGKAYFDDICHLTPAGSERFVANILATVDVEQPTGVDNRRSVVRDGGSDRPR